MNKYLKISLFAALGAGLGFAYYYFVGCRSGSCPITSNWYLTTLYGALMGLILGFPARKKVKDEKLSGVTPDRDADKNE
ncbi:MAG: hypothetical protein A2475_03880 [Ignavibacteria bacterium RIFOXYC2_FULL_35_21]|nr:MAG: hypothetical protein A2220_02990 [Ignavibacteria bacterium RIFOXYA2_FULL_35_10]OGV21703.1 MAG: hypothetical protein A2475_03880 [Ignavibacteria bacterium RIFOXYC2_FULL_35_21]